MQEMHFSWPICILSFFIDIKIVKKAHAHVIGKYIEGRACNQMKPINFRDPHALANQTL